MNRFTGVLFQMEPSDAKPLFVPLCGAALFVPQGRARGSIILSGGRTEPIEKYYEVIADFLERDFVVLAHDWRGQGLSARLLADPLKGHASGYKAYLEDFERLPIHNFADMVGYGCNPVFEISLPYGDIDGLMPFMA